MESKKMLVVCEKPSVARALGAALGCKKNGKGFIEGNGYAITWCMGHLIETAQPGAYGEEYVKWKLEHLPILPERWKYEVKDAVRGQFQTVKGLMSDKGFSCTVNACDAGREGELIFRLVYEKAGCRLPIKRLWISSMEESAIQEGFRKLKDGKEFENLCQCALARQKADWIVGINGTRLFSVLYRGKVRKVGRVQSPTLAMIAEREREIGGFVKKPFYTVRLFADGLEAVSERMGDKEEAESLAKRCDGGKVRVRKVEKEERTSAPPKLFDLTSLQREANRLFGLTAKETLDCAQSLYEQRLCTYPRTDSRHLSNDMGETARKVLEAVKEAMGFVGSLDLEAADTGALLDSAKVTDHHAIIPTARIAKADLGALPSGERKVLSLIAAGLACAVSKPERETVLKAGLECAGAPFTSSKRFRVDRGWRAVHDGMRKETQADGGGQEDDGGGNGGEAAGGAGFSNLVEGMSFTVKAEAHEGFTKPPARYTEAALLSAMEKAGAEDTDDGAERKGLGTPATRADIIEKLVNDNYVCRERKSLLPTEAGKELAEILPEKLKSPKLTAEWENALLKISKGEMDAETFLDGIERMVKELVEEYGHQRKQGVPRHPS